MKTLTEYLVEAFSKTKLFEMAIERKEYLNLVKNLEQQIFENWCLIRYAKLYGNNNQKQCINHWKKELFSYIKRLSNVDIKCGKKINVLKQYWIKEYEYDTHPGLISSMIILKFEKENIDCMDDNQYKEMNHITELCSKEIKVLTDVIVNYDDYHIQQYIKNL